LYGIYQPSRLFLVAGFVSVGSAIGIEMISAKYVSLFGSQNLGYALIIACEEGGEMTGVAIFLCAGKAECREPSI
jgi:hypothetical protein